MDSPPWYDPNPGLRLGIEEAGPAPSGELSRLSAFGDTATLTAGAHVMAWTHLDVSEGSDITIDSGDPTILHFTAGAYLIQTQANSSGTATSGTVEYLLDSGTNWPGGDGPPDPIALRFNSQVAAWGMWWLYTIGGTLRIQAQFTGATTGDTVSGGGIDIVRLGG